MKIIEYFDQISGFQNMFWKISTLLWKCFFGNSVF